MEYCKLQIGCMIIVLYVACIYIREKQIYQMKRKNGIESKKAYRSL